MEFFQSSGVLPQKTAQVLYVKDFILNIYKSLGLSEVDTDHFLVQITGYEDLEAY